MRLFGDFPVAHAQTKIVKNFPAILVAFVVVVLLLLLLLLVVLFFFFSFCWG